MPYAIIASAIFVIWLLLSGHYDAMFITMGIISTAITMRITLRMHASDRLATMVTYHVRPRVWLYQLWMFKEIIISSIVVTYRVWRGGKAISPITEDVPTTATTDYGKTYYANSITMTPGTVCLAVDDKKLRVHALHKSGIDSLKEGTMDGVITKAVEK